MRTDSLNLSRRRLLVSAAAWSGIPLATWLAAADPAAVAPDLTLDRDEHFLFIRSAGMPDIRINYLEAYCRPGSTDADWGKYTVIPHRRVESVVSDDKRKLTQRDELSDGVIVRHVVAAGKGEVDFRLEAHNPADKASETHWAQPCVRLGPFCGFPSDGGGNLDDYLPKCFVWLEGKLTRMPFQPWAKEARYIPGQVWCPKNVPRTDVNPRPLSTLVPSHGLIGCVSADEKLIFATAWEPYQELFQGVARCLHSDFRIGGLAPGEKKTIRGKVYVLPNDPAALFSRYLADFPEHGADAQRKTPAAKPC